ncbi:MAG: phosphoenolpyruvate-utilizing protein [Acidimicrobiia bacterium]|nr:phosphoenolpyruvate-utilizing protein [Acidimicrobiia bacterium]
MNERVWVVDDAPSRRFPIYTRGNVGEVFPDVVSPLSWSAYGGEAELGWREAWRDYGVLLDRDVQEDNKVIIGCFGGYAYLNASYIRVFAVRTPGINVADMDALFFGDSAAPPYRQHAGDKSVAASLRIGRTILTTLSAKALPELEDDKQRVRAWLTSLPDPTTASDQDLLGVATGFRPLFRHLYRRHILTTFRVFIGSGVLAQICERKLGDPTLITPLLSGIGSVESAEPSWAMWRLARMAADDPAIAAVFDAGVDDIESRLEAEPAAAAFRQGLTAFLDDFGSRGPNEWEGSSPTWGTAPRLALAAIDRMRVADAAHDPELQHRRLRAEREAATGAARARLPGLTRAQFDRAVRSTHLFSQGRERSKTTIIRAIHGLRLAQLELARRARERGGPDDLADMWLLTLDELGDYVAAPEGFKAVIDERRQQRNELGSLVPPFVFEGVQPPVSTWEHRDRPVDLLGPGSVLRGIPGCPGLARGRARVVLDPFDPRGLAPGEVLVAPITDPSWTPLFLAAEAVVVDVGAQMSHAVIVSRELGIPAVVSATGATNVIPDGAEIEVDGTAGLIRVLGLDNGL